MNQIQTFEQLYNHLQTLNLESFKTFLSTPWKSKTFSIEVQESVFRLFVFLGLLKPFQDYTICLGSFNNGESRPIHDTERQLFWSTNCKDKGSSSDLTLVNETSFIVTSSKNNSKGSRVKQLDIGVLLAIYNEYYQASEKEFRLCLVVKDKTQLIKACESADRTSELEVSYIQNESTILIDWIDLQSAFVSFLGHFSDLSVNDISYSSKKWMTLRFHQALAVEQLKRWWIESKVTRVLLGQKCRSGKSYVMLGTMSAYALEYPGSNFLLMTPVPSSLLELQRIVSEYKQFEGYQVIVLDRHTKPPSQTIKLIIIVSKHFLQSKGTKASNQVNKIEWLSALSFGLRFVDETHQGGTTSLTQKVLDTYGGRFLFTIFVTASFLKPVLAYQIPESYQIKWDLEDEQLCTSLTTPKNLRRLCEKHGKDVKSLLPEYPTLAEDYSKMPRFHLLTWQLQPDVKEDLQSFLASTDQAYGLSIESLFQLYTVNHVHRFLEEDKLKQLCDSIFPSTQDKGLIRREIKQTLFDRAFELSRLYQSRWLLSPESSNPLIVLCFLPCGLPNTPIDHLQEAFVEMLHRHHFLEDFLILCVNSKTNGSQDALQKVHDAVSRAKHLRKRGVLVLTGRQLSLAVSLEHCDIVLMMNSTQSLDFYYQSSFRCMTESKHKTIGIVIDVNFRRAVNMAVAFSSEFRKDISVKQALTYCIEQNLIGINRDHYMTSQERVIDFVYDTWATMPAQNIQYLMDRFDVSFDIPKEQKLLWNRLIRSASITIKKIPKKIIPVTELDGNDRDIPDGLSISSSVSSTVSSSDNISVD